MAAEYSTVALPVNPTTSYLTTDLLGSPRVITDRQGNVVSRRDFMPFGEEIGAGVGGRTESLKYSLNGSDNIRKRFTGYEKDEETGLDFAEARMYRNNHGRFTAPDPLLSSASLGNPQTFNRYVYVGNNPVNVTDPLGLKWCHKKDTKDYQEGYSTCPDGWESADGREVTTLNDWTDHNARKGAVVILNEDDTVTIVRAPKSQVEEEGALVQDQSNPQTVDAPTGEIGSAISPRQIVRGPDLGCPTGSDSACGNGNVSLSPSLDTENNAPLGAVAGIEKIAEAGQMVPGLNVPATILKSAIDLGQGEIGEAGLNTAGLIPFGSLFRRGHRFINAVDNVADATRALCFVAGTLVHTDEGLVPIELIEPGDSVLSYNETNGQLEFREVVRLFRNTADEVLKIQIEGEPQTLQVTLRHPFYVHRNRNNLSADDGDWIAAEWLKAGDLLKNSAGEWKPIIAIERVAETRATFNFEVEGNHNYFVGLGGWLVHNDCWSLARESKELAGGGSLVKITQVDPLGGPSKWLSLPKGLYPDVRWAEPVVHINQGKVIDKLSKYGNKAVPFKDWVKHWDLSETVLTNVNKLE
ncbi:MAG: hypothetical protein IPJ30_16595 [Acidobacteria bacterium]|nr:hypothetical protein [Acidobacteriota bacterium]